jgi:hypothetical protein
MYFMIGGDEQEYGPVAAEQLREWLAAGRANGETKLRVEGATEWKPLAQYPEFAEALAARRAAAGPAPSTASPSSTVGAGGSAGETAGTGTGSGTGSAPLPPGTPGSSFAGVPVGMLDPDALAAAALARPYEVNVGLLIGRGWDLLKSDFWPIVGVNALMFIVMSAAGAAYVGILLNGPLIAGLYVYCLKRIRGQQANLNDAFSGFQNFVQLMLGGLVTTLLISIGTLFCFIPGIYLSVAWQLTFPLIQERQIGFWEAMEVSRKVISKHFWGVFLLMLMLFLINFAGALCCVVGLFVTVPLSFLALAYLYEDLFGPPGALAQGAPNELAPVQPPN